MPSEISFEEWIRDVYGAFQKNEGLRKIFEEDGWVEEDGHLNFEFAERYFNARVAGERFDSGASLPVFLPTRTERRMYGAGYKQRV